MTPRTKKIVWGAFIVLVGVGLYWAYRRWVLTAPQSAFEWQKDGVTYELLNPKTLGLVLLAPLLLFIGAKPPIFLAARAVGASGSRSSRWSRWGWREGPHRGNQEGRGGF
jgi:hypothetical protein